MFDPSSIARSAFARDEGCAEGPKFWLGCRAGGGMMFGSKSGNCEEVTLPDEDVGVDGDALPSLDFTASSWGLPAGRC